MLKHRSRGDTIVEVIVAFAVFSLVAVGTVTVMNRGVAAAERSLEVTLVRQQIDAQAELLRYARNIESPAWDSVKANWVANAPAINTTACPASPPNKSFIVSADTLVSPATLNYYDMDAAPTTYKEASVHSQFTLGTSPVVASGFWVNAVRANTGSASATTAYDMYITACWYPPGSDDPEYLRTIVRIYDKN